MAWQVVMQCPVTITHRDTGLKVLVGVHRVQTRGQELWSPLVITNIPSIVQHSGLHTDKNTLRNKADFEARQIAKTKTLIPPSI